MKKLIIASLLFFAAAFLGIHYYFSDIQINKYPDKKSVIHDGAIQRGWVPELLPDSAYNIEETHDIDTNELYGRFYYKEPDEKAFLELLFPIPDSNGTYRWKGYLFKIDRKNNQVKYRNDPGKMIRKEND